MNLPERSPGPTATAAVHPTAPIAPHELLRRYRRGASVTALAKELGVTEAKLRSALQTLHQKKRDEFAQKLADALGIPVQKVKDALPDKPGP